MGLSRILTAAIVGSLGYSGLPTISLDAAIDDGASQRHDVQSRYQVGAVTRAELTKIVTTTGTIDATINIEVGSQLSGQIASTAVDFNDSVRKGQVLAQLDDQTFRTLVDSSRAALEGAKADVRVAEARLARAQIDADHAAAQRAVLAARTEAARFEEEVALRQSQRKAALGGKGVVAASEVEDTGSRALEASARRREAEGILWAQDAVEQGARADVVRAAAEMESARAAVQRLAAQLQGAMIDLERTRIRSPIDGVVVGRNVTQGQTLASTLEARTLFVVAADLRRVEVHARIDESDISQIAVGQAAQFTVDAFPNRRFQATVTQIRREPKIIQNVVTYVVILTTANEDLALLPGMTVVAKVETAHLVAPLTVPLAALRFRPHAPGQAAASSSSVVWTLRDGAPTPVRVTVGSQDGERAEITSGDLRPGDPVVTGETTAGSYTLPIRRGNG